MTSTYKIAWFITPHGFGHACRAAAVMAALNEAAPGFRFELFTTCPKWLFEDAIGNDFGHHTVETDIGLVQTSPLKEDLAATCLRLDQMLPFNKDRVLVMADEIKRLECRLVICDIAPMGIRVARAAGIPSLLLENFTWDWIYQGYLAAEPRLAPHIDYLSEVNRQADHHIQARPVCRPSKMAVRVDPVSRKVRCPGDQVRRRLGISATAKLVMVSMGGVPDRLDFFSRLPSELEPFLVIPGINGRQISHPKIILLPPRSPFHHPDLIAAADVLVGKAGYSTVAEAYQAGIPFGYITRPDFPESAVLENFIARHLPARAISAADYQSGHWIEALPELLNLNRSRPPAANGADQAARYIIKTFFA